MLPTSTRSMIKRESQQMYLQNKYARWYYNIINRAKTRTLGAEIYTESHHIIPKSLGGDNSVDNLVVLTAHEHLVCHLLLIKMTEGLAKRKMAFAAFCMTTMANPHQNRVRISGRVYELLRKEHGNAVRERQTGTKHSLERNKNISESKRGKKLGPQTEDHKRNNALAQKWFGKKRGSPSDDHRNKTLEGIKRSATTCEHCNITISFGNYQRWHGNNCRSRRG